MGKLKIDDDRRGGCNIPVQRGGKDDRGGDKMNAAKRKEEQGVSSV